MKYNYGLELFIDFFYLRIIGEQIIARGNKILNLCFNAREYA